LQAWRRRERDSRQKVTLCQNNVTNAERRVNESNAQITTNQTIVDSKKQEIELAEGEVAGFTIAGVWNIDWKESPKEFIAKLTEEQRKYENNVSEKRELNNQVALAEQECQSIRMAINSIKGQMPSWEKNDLAIAKKIDNLLNKFNEISRQISIEQLKLQRATNDYQSNQQDLDAFLAENPSIGIPRLTDLDKLSREYIEKMNNDIQDARDRHIAAQTSLKNAQERYGNHQQRKPNLTENDSLELLTNELNDYDEKLNENNQEQGGINQELDTNIKNRERLQEFIKLEEQKKTEYQKWKRLCDLIGDSVGKEFRKIAQSYVLASLIHSANSYMRTLTDRYTLKVVPGTFIISLEDAYQGYVSRAASTISGGESFLVSLSLALALSDIGQTLSVDTLFIDEGFGTLSGEPLQNAINTLRSLHTKAGRHVGIISHIEELRERIPVQIQVQQEGNNSSSTIEIVNLQN
jgi:exonuclease SbcC